MKYDEMKEISDKIILLYNEVALNNNIEIYNYNMPHIANFDKSDNVISIMGINPSVNKDKRNVIDNKKYDPKVFCKENDINLDLYYVPEYDNLLEETKSKLKDKFICNFARKPYNLICGKENLPYKRLLKMQWQKFDDSFIKETYGIEKFNEYSELIKEIELQYNMDLFEDKYLIFTNLIYVSDYNQNNICKVIEAPKYYKKFAELINKLLNYQLEYYNINLLIVANSYASKYLRKYILLKDKDWVKSNESIHTYKNTKTNKTVYLTARYFDRMDIFSRELFYEDLCKIKEKLQR